MTEAHPPVQSVARLTGLSTHVIRIWEQRYHAVEPRRTPTNHPRYLHGDIQRLTLLRDVTRAGHNNSQLARLSNDNFRAPAANASGRKPKAPGSAVATLVPDDLLAGCLASVQSLDGHAMPAYPEVLERLGAVLAKDLTRLGLALDRLRQPLRKAER